MNDICIVEEVGHDDGVVETIEMDSDGEAGGLLALLVAQSPWERMAAEAEAPIVIVADPADFLEERRLLVGDMAMALEFGDPALPAKPSDLVDGFIACPAEVRDEEISDALDQFEMTIHTRRVTPEERKALRLRACTHGGWAMEGS